MQHKIINLNFIFSIQLNLAVEYTFRVNLNCIIELGRILQSLNYLYGIRYMQMISPGILKSLMLCKQFKKFLQCNLSRSLLSISKVDFKCRYKLKKSLNFLSIEEEKNLIQCTSMAVNALFSKALFVLLK